MSLPSGEANDPAERAPGSDELPRQARYRVRRTLPGLVSPAQVLLLAIGVLLSLAVALRFSPPLSGVFVIAAPFVGLWMAWMLIKIVLPPLPGCACGRSCRHAHYRILRPDEMPCLIVCECGLAYLFIEECSPDEEVVVFVLRIDEEWNLYPHKKMGGVLERWVDARDYRGPRTLVEAGQGRRDDPAAPSTAHW